MRFFVQDTKAHIFEVPLKRRLGRSLYRLPVSFNGLIVVKLINKVGIVQFGINVCHLILAAIRKHSHGH